MAAPKVLSGFQLINNGMNISTDPVTGLPMGGLGSSGRLYQAKISLTASGAGATSSAIVLPAGPLFDVELQFVSGTPTVYATCASNSDIVAGNAVWAEFSVSGITLVPLGYNALYLVSDGGADVAIINARCAA